MSTTPKKPTPAKSEVEKCDCFDGWVVIQEGGKPICVHCPKCNPKESETS